MPPVHLVTLLRVTTMRASASRRSGSPFAGTTRHRASCVASLFLALALDLYSAEWPQFLGPKRNGSCTVTNLAAAWPAEGPPVLWQRQVGEGFSGPVVSRSRLILFHRIADRETVECLEDRKSTRLN